MALDSATVRTARCRRFRGQDEVMRAWCHELRPSNECSDQTCRGGSRSLGLHEALADYWALGLWYFHDLRVDHY